MAGLSSLCYTSRMANTVDLTTKDPDIQYLLRDNIVAPSPREAQAIQARAEEKLEQEGFGVLDKDYVDADVSSIPSPSNQAPATAEEVEQFRAEVVKDEEEPAAVGPAPERAQAVIDGTFPVPEVDEDEPTTVGGVPVSEHQAEQESQAVADQAAEAAVSQPQRTEAEQEAVEEYEPESESDEEPEPAAEQVEESE